MARLGLATARLHLEPFNAAVAIGGVPVVIMAARRGLRLEVAADRSAPEVTVAVGMPVALSCEQGGCGNCLTTVLAGEAEHRDSVRAAKERTFSRRMALCCSRGRTVVLDL